MALRCGIDWEKSRLSHQLRRMEQRGLVIRGHCAEDNRGAVVRITEAGRALAEEAQRVHEVAVHRYVCGVLTRDQLDALGQISEAILARLDDPREVASESTSAGSPVGSVGSSAR
jgi:DNA-binding MarR family transcriptional regulator